MVYSYSMRVLLTRYIYRANRFFFIYTYSVIACVNTYNIIAVDKTIAIASGVVF